MKKFSLKSIPKKLIVGDPWYFEKCDENSKPRLSKLCIIRNRILGQKDHVGSILIHETDEYSIEILIAVARIQEIVDTYLDDRHWEKELKKSMALGCDTAHFILETDTGSFSCHTGADGYYGDYSEYSKDFGYILRLWLDKSLFTEEDAVSFVKQAFDVEEKEEE